MSCVIIDHFKVCLDSNTSFMYIDSLCNLSFHCIGFTEFSQGVNAHSVNRVVFCMLSEVLVESLKTQKGQA